MNEDEGQETHEVSAEDRVLRFLGTKLGYASSAGSGKLRWAEISIYRTIAGTYIVAGVGRSTVPNETDRHWAQVCEEPEAVIERLHLVDSNGGKYLPNVGRQALRQAQGLDEALRNAYLVEVVD